MNIDIDELRAWIGRSEILRDTVTAVPIRALGATLDRETGSVDAAYTLPPLWHWLYFLPTASASQVGLDGHPQRGGFLPPVPLPRRMWAGSQLRFNRPIRLGQAIQRQSVISDVRLKQGRSGPLVFVKVDHEIHADGELALSERHDIVYRDMARPSAEGSSARSAPDKAEWQREVAPDPVLLFRYSALTFNSHRIHYDRSYATNGEGYPGLVVHGPLIATLLLELVHEKLPLAHVQAFEFRAVSALFDTAPFLVCGCREGEDTVRLWAQTTDGQLAMEAVARLG